MGIIRDLLTGALPLSELPGFLASLLTPGHINDPADLVLDVEQPEEAEYTAPCARPLKPLINK